MVTPAPRASRPCWLVLSLLMLALPLAGCDKVALTAPTQSTITLFTIASVLPWATNCAKGVNLSTAVASGSDSCESDSAGALN